MKKIICIASALILCFSLIACSNSKNQTSSDSKDKIDLVLQATDTTPKGKDKVALIAKNTSDAMLTLNAIIILAYDKNLNFIETTDANSSVKLHPGEKSRKFNFTINGKPAMIKIVGYEYTQNGKTYLDKFNRNIISHGYTFSEVYGSFTDKQLLEKEY